MVEVFEQELRHRHVAAAQPARHVVLVLQKHGAVCRDPLLRSRLDVRGPDQTSAERRGRHQVGESVGKVFAHHVLVELFRVLAVRAKFQRRLAFEHRPRHLCRREHDLDRYEVARRAFQAEVPPRSERDRDVLAVNRQHPGKLLRVVRVALLVDQVELGRQRDVERRAILKQRPRLCFGPACGQDLLARPRFGELRNRVLFGRRCRRRVLSQERVRGQQRKQRGRGTGSALP